MINDLKYWKTDIPAGLVVFLVAIPLCLGIALASGAPPLSGIIAGIAGGLIVTIFSDSSLGVSGPAAGLVAIVFPAIEKLGFENFLLAVVIGGIIQLVLGVFKAGAIGYYFPNAVIQGMLVAIGLIIIIKEIPYALGSQGGGGGGHGILGSIPHLFDSWSIGPILVSIVGLAILIFWQTNAIKRFSASKIIQGPLVAVVAGILMYLAFRAISSLSLTEKDLVALPTTGFWSELTFPSLEKIASPGIYITGLTLAIVASLESLLCAEATDKLDPQRRQTDLSRELKAQGIGNIASGLVGGLPVTQVIVRSSTNIQSGAQSRLAAFVHGLFLIVCVAATPWLLNMIPLASLAAVLLVVGYKLAHPSKFEKMFSQGWSQFLPFIITVIAILATDLLIGIGVGLVASVFYILKASYENSFWMQECEEGGRKTYRMLLAESVCFLNKGNIKAALNKIEPGSKLIIDASDTADIDKDVVEVFNAFETNAKFQNIEVERIDFIEKHHDPARARRLTDSERMRAVGDG